MIKRAGFRQLAAATDIDYHPDQGLDRNHVGRLLSLNFAERPRT
ncbi:MAG: hypothetical protein U5K69_19085 [Balneolaceae bacterium]|nr:hypothetical protein [Balneolaceae bacterium]